MASASGIHPSYKRILAIDGGGFGGLGCLLIVDKIMEEVKKRSQQLLFPCQVFDLVCGTSTGGLVALLLGRFGLDCSTAIKAYKNLVISVVGDADRNSWDKLLKSSDFDSKAYELALEKLAVEYGGDVNPLMMLPANTADKISHRSTKTFVTVGSYAPNYADRVYHIRSYPTPLGGSESSPLSYRWTVRQAARATTAGRYTHTPPLLIRDSAAESEFIDAGIIGFNNPTHLARREAKRLWKDDQIGVVISLGTGLSALAPSKPTTAWTVTDIHATPFVDAIIRELPSSTASQEISRKNAMVTIKQLVSTAVETELVHINTASELRENDLYYRINPSPGFGAADLLDFSHNSKVEEAIKRWLDDPKQKQFIQAVASKLVHVGTAPLPAIMTPRVRTGSLHMLGPKPHIGGGLRNMQSGMPGRQDIGMQSPGAEIEIFGHL